MTEDRPNRLPWPPIILVTAFLSGALLNALIPLGFPAIAPPGIIHAAGMAIMAAGLALDVSAIFTMWRARTNILPHRAAGRLVTRGVFALSRNPIYTGNTLLVLGASGVFENIWFAIAAIVAAVAVYRLAIKREEAHLAARFGDDWQAYKAKTPRWLLF